MQRCPYMHEMHERLLGPTLPRPIIRNDNIRMSSFDRESECLLQSRPESRQILTMVKLNPDGFGSHTTPTHQKAPLVPCSETDDSEDDVIDVKTNVQKMIEGRKPKNAKTSLFIVTSLVYAMLLIVVCTAYVISDVTTHQIPVIYYEGFFTYLYGASILFLLYVFCFLLQESSCCNGKPKPPKEKKPKKEKKEKKPKKSEEAKDAKDGKDGKDAAKDGKDGKDAKETKETKESKSAAKTVAVPPVAKPSPYQPESSTADIEAASSPRCGRKTTTDQTHGSFFLRVGAIAFGLGTMIYTGLEFGSFFEIPFTSPCHQILKGVNPLLQMVFTFMQMYFIFMNARLNIHRFKVLARFGLMHIVATNICVWIRTLVLESLKEITAYHLGKGIKHEDGVILDNIRQHTLKNAELVLGNELRPSGTVTDTEWEPISVNMNAHDNLSQESNVLSKMIHTTVQALTTKLLTTTTSMPTTPTTTTTTPIPTTPSTTSTMSTTIEPTITTTASTTLFNRIQNIISTDAPHAIHEFEESNEEFDSEATSSTVSTTIDSLLNGNNFVVDHFLERNYSHDREYERLEDLFPQSFFSTNGFTPNSTNCGRVNIMGTIVQDSAPYLYPFIIEYSLIGAAVIYVMWKHIGRYPKFTNEEDLEHRLEVMLSRRAVVMAQQARTGRVDCVGASKGLFFGLLLLVGSLICLILFFVLVRHPQLSLLAIYLADASHGALMILAIFAIIIGFIRVQQLKFRVEEQSNLNDILLRISAFGLFIYSTFSVIAGSLNAMESEPNLLVMVTGIVAIVQVVIQLLFIADVARRRVHLPEHDRIKPGRQIVTFLLICNVSMFVIYTFEAQKVFANPVQLDFYGFIAWSLIQRVCLPLCIFHRFHSAVTLAEIWKTTYKARLE